MFYNIIKYFNTLIWNFQTDLSIVYDAHQLA
jgi:hypothetical protein